LKGIDGRMAQALEGRESPEPDEGKEECRDGADDARSDACDRRDSSNGSPERVNERPAAVEGEYAGEYPIALGMRSRFVIRDMTPKITATVDIRFVVPRGAGAGVSVAAVGAGAYGDGAAACRCSVHCEPSHRRYYPGL